METSTFDCKHVCRRTLLGLEETQQSSSEPKCKAVQKRKLLKVSMYSNAHFTVQLKAIC